MVELNKTTAIGAIVVLLASLLMLVVFYPAIQELLYTITIQSPGLLFWVLIGVIGVGVGFRTGRQNTGLAIGAVALIMVVVAVPFFSGVYAQESILESQQFEQKAELDETSTEHVRILPQNVADRYAESANQLPQYKTGESDIAYQDGNYKWAYPIEPGPLFVKLQGNQYGAYYVDMEQTSRSVDRIESDIRYGKGQLIVDRFSYQLKLDKPLVDHKYDTTFVFEDDGETHIARSYVSHDWEWRTLPVPMPYAVPKYGGTQVMNPDGEIDDYTPEEVESSDMFKSQNTYPYGLAKFRMKSMQLRNGLINKLFYQKGVPEVARTGGFSDNEQPFTVPMDGGENPELNYFIAATPAGAGDGIYQIYQIDGQSGDIEYVQFNSTQAGPQKAAGYTRSQDREPNWAANNEEGSTQITEPIPLIID